MEIGKNSCLVFLNGLVLFCSVMLSLSLIGLTNQSRTQGEGWSTANLLTPPPPPPSNFMAGRPKAALLVWFFGDFRCGLPLFIVISVIYINIKNR